MNYDFGKNFEGNSSHIIDVLSQNLFGGTEVKGKVVPVLN
jgi:hypothetical protein